MRTNNLIEHVQKLLKKLPVGTIDKDNPHLITLGRDRSGAFKYLVRHTEDPFIGTDELLGQLLLAVPRLIQFIEDQPVVHTELKLRLWLAVCPKRGCGVLEHSARVAETADEARNQMVQFMAGHLVLSHKMKVTRKRMPAFKVMEFVPMGRPR